MNLPGWHLHPLKGNLSDFPTADYDLWMAGKRAKALLKRIKPIAADRLAAAA